MTEAAWTLIEARLPPAKPVGRPRTTDLREVVTALFYLLRGGAPWRLLAKDYPRRSTVQRNFYDWRAAGVWQLDQLLSKRRQRPMRCFLRYGRLLLWVRFGSRAGRQEGPLPEVNQTESGAKQTSPLEGLLSGVERTYPDQGQNSRL